MILFIYFLFTDLKKAKKSIQKRKIVDGKEVDDDSITGVVVNTLGKIVVDIMINLADEEVRTLKQRSKSGILSGIKAGKVGGGKFKPYGFKVGDNKMIEIDYEEAQYVELIFNLYKSGKGTKVIANTLNNHEDDIKTRAHKSFGNDLLNLNELKKIHERLSKQAKNNSPTIHSPA